MRSTGVAQSFLESVNASIAPKDEPQVLLATHGLSPTQPSACECCCQCGRGYKPGRNVTKRSKSYTNLRTGIFEIHDSGLETPVKPVERPVKVKQYPTGESPIERLPSEVLGKGKPESVFVKGARAKL